MTKELPPCSIEELDEIIRVVHEHSLADFEEKVRELIVRPGRSLEEMRAIVDAARERELLLFEKSQSQPGLRKAAKH